MQFAKWHGLGNDYIIIRGEHIPPEARDVSAPLRAAVAARLCDRHFGIGADGILVLDESSSSDAHMTIYNPDGSQAEMCGNGIRMAARFLAGPHSERSLSIDTAGGTVRPTVRSDGLVCVDMGTVEDLGLLGIEADGALWSGRYLSVGNPHFVIAGSPGQVALERIGPLLEHDAHFPNRTNVEFFERTGDASVTMRVWERGVGETLACGSGACAVAVSAVLDAGCASPVRVTLPGGDLEIEVDGDLSVRMTGPAEETFRGSVSPRLLAALMPQEAFA